MAATIRDVARRAQVAPSTVSAVLNNKGYVHHDTRARIEQAIRDLKYIPRRSARSLTTQTSGNIGFIVNENHFTRAEPFYTKVFLGTEFQARKHDFYVLLTSVGDTYKSFRDMPRFLLEHNVDGVIIAGSAPEKLIQDAVDQGVPVVLVDYANGGRSLTRVLIDNRHGARLATQHLLELGHTEIGFIGGNRPHPSRIERFEGFETAMREAGLDVKQQWVQLSDTRSSVELGEEQFRELWRKPDNPTALICFNDAIAMGVLRAAKVLGISIPTDLSVVGFDDVDSCAHTSPPLTTLRVQKEELGMVAMRTIHDMILGKQQAPVSTRIGVELVVRQSTGSVSPKQRGTAHRDNV